MGAWRQYDFRATVREAEAKGFKFKMSDDPFEGIRKDWHAAFRWATWFERKRELDLPESTDLAPIGTLLHRLGLTRLFAPGCTNVDGLKGLTALQWLNLDGCRALQNVDGLTGFTVLHRLDLSACLVLQNVDGLKELTALQEFYLHDCPALQNVDGLKGLPAP